MKSTAKTPNEDDSLINGTITTLWARTAVFVYMVLACIACGWGAYYTFYEYENKLRFAGYSAIVDELADATGESLTRNKLTIQLLAQAIGVQCPDAAIWPNCSVPMRGFQTYNRLMTNATEVKTLSLSPILTKHQVAPFEEFAYDFFESEGYGPPFNLGITSIGKGIFAANQSNGGQLYHTVDEFAGGENPIFVPVFQVGYIAENSGAVMFNMYTESVRARAMDDVINCTNTRSDMSQCGSITDVLNLVVDSEVRPAALTFHPIFPRNNNKTLVGFSIAVLYWDTMLRNHLPNSVADFDVVVASKTTSYTFTVKGGHAVLKGPGDIHDCTFNDRAVTVPLDTFTYSSVSYTLSIYPTSSFDSQTATTYPIFAAVVAVGVIVLTTFVVYMYDSSVTRAVREREVILETKRLFVRYISHEIRTPLNTVHLGLVVLLGEMERLIQDVMALPLLKPKADANNDTFLSSSPGSVRDEGSNVPVTKEYKAYNTAAERKKEGIVSDISSWITLINEIEESSDVAVTVLNDLINYDKIVGGLLKMDISEVTFWPLLLNTIKPFKLEAKEKNIELKLRNNFSEEEMLRMIVIADSVKLAQVVRNLVSNALKFTPRNGLVSITVEWIGKDELCSDLNVINSNVTNEEAFDLSKYHIVGNIRLSVRDSGVGMTDANLKELFREGVQFNPNQLQGGQGSGLGLWVSKGFVLRHGGVLSATSEGLGLGSTFVMQLPLFVSKENWEHNHIPSGPVVNDVINDLNVLSSFEGHELRNCRSNDFLINGEVEDDASHRSVSGSSKVIKSMSTGNGPPSFSVVEPGMGRRILNEGSQSRTTMEVPLETDDRELSALREKEISDRISLHSTPPAGRDKSRPSSLSPLLTNQEASVSTQNVGEYPLLRCGSQHSNSNPPKTAEAPVVKPIETILVVDDATSNRKILCRLLKNGGYSTTEAENGQICVDMLSKMLLNEAPQPTSFDLILMDYHMPVMNGPEAAKALRNLGCSCPIIGLTGNVLEKDVSDFIASGVNAVLSKPIQFPSLSKLIRELEGKP